MYFLSSVIFIPWSKNGPFWSWKVILELITLSFGLGRGTQINTQSSEEWLGRVGMRAGEVGNGKNIMSMTLLHLVHGNSKWSKSLHNYPTMAIRINYKCIQDECIDNVMLADLCSASQLWLKMCAMHNMSTGQSPY